MTLGRRLDFLHRRHYKVSNAESIQWTKIGLMVILWSLFGSDGWESFRVLNVTSRDGVPSRPAFSKLQRITARLLCQGLNLVHGIYVLCTQRALIAVGFRIPEVLPCRAGHSRLNWSLFHHHHTSHRVLMRRNPRATFTTE